MLSTGECEDPRPSNRTGSKKLKISKKIISKISKIIGYKNEPEKVYSSEKFTQTTGYTRGDVLFKPITLTTVSKSFLFSVKISY